MSRNRSGSTVALVVAAVIAIAATGYCWFFWLPARQAYNRCVAYFERAIPGDDLPEKSPTPTTDLINLLKGPHGPSYLRSLDEKFEWVAYDADRNGVYYLTRFEDDQKVRINYEVLSAAACGSQGLTHQLEPQSVEFRDGCLWLGLRTRASHPGDVGILESWGVAPGSFYVARLDPFDRWGEWSGRTPEKLLADVTSVHP